MKLSRYPPKKEDMRRPLLCWIDLETTGLDPERHRILQAAVVITDTNLEPVAPAFEVVIHRGPSTLGLMDDYVRAMHTKTGLLARVEQSCVRAEAAYSDLYAHVRNITAGTPPPILAGSSVHFDRKFLAKYIPKLEALFYHRHMDVSALKHCAEWWGYPSFAKSGVAHIAMDDIKNSISELRFYKENMLREV